MKMLKKLVPIALVLVLLSVLVPTPVLAALMASSVTASDVNAGVMAQYSFGWTSNLEGKIKTIEIDFPVGFDLSNGSIVSASHEGNLSAGPTRLTYTLSSVTELQNVAVSLVVNDIKNHKTSATYPITLTTKLANENLVENNAALGSVSIIAPTTSVTATVTTALVALSVTPYSIDYGIMSLNAASDVKSITVQNRGTVTQEINIKGADAVFSSNAWTLGSTVGADQYSHYWGLADPPTTPLTTNYATLTSNLVSDGSEVFYLRLLTPTATTLYGQYSTTITLQAVQTD